MRDRLLLPCLAVGVFAACGGDEPVEVEDMSSTQDMPGEVEDMTAPPDMSSDAPDLDEREPDLSSGEDMAAPVDMGPPAWTWRAARATQVHVPGSSGCLRQSPDYFEPGDVVALSAANEHWGLVASEGDDVGLVELAHFEELTRPADMETLPPGRPAIAANTFTRHTWGRDGCPMELEEVAELTEFEAFAKFHDAQYRGWAVIDRQLGLGPVRRVEAEGWEFPWGSAVQIIKELDEGFVTGGGVLIGPRHLLTVAHLGVDETYCYSREPVTGVAWEAGEVVCDNVAAVTPHPMGVDAAIVELVADEAPPFTTLSDESPVVGQEFYTTDYSSLHRNSFYDGEVRSVGRDNAYCQDWPASSTFMSEQLLISPGDSGGPAYSGDTLIGLVHGERCRRPIEPQRHIFINVAGLRGWIDEVLSGEE